MQSAKIQSLIKIRNCIEQAQASNKRVVYCHGVFVFMKPHTGHLSTENHLKMAGVPDEEGYPNLMPGQKMFFGEDNIQNIQNEFNALCRIIEDNVMNGDCTLPGNSNAL